MSDVFQGVLFQEGEGLVSEDFNLLGSRQKSQLLDGFLSQMARVTDFEGSALGASASHLFCVGNSGAVYASATARTSKFLGGPIFQRIGSGAPDGITPQFLMYYLTDNEAGQTHAAPSADPRWDLISVKLELEDQDESRDFKDAVTDALSSQTLDKTRRVKATITVTAGAEGATPNMPATPAGHVKLAAVKVPVGATAFDPLTDIRDYRVPIGHRVERSRAFDFEWDSDEPLLTIDGGAALGQVIQDGAIAGGQTLHAVLREGGCGCRVLGLWTQLTGSDALTTVRFKRVPTGTLLWDISSAAGAGLADRHVYHDVLASFPDPLGGSDTGVPLWANGYTCGYAIDKTLTFPVTNPAAAAQLGNIAVRVVTQAGDGVSIGPFRWLVAGN